MLLKIRCRLLQLIFLFFLFGTSVFANQIPSEIHWQNWSENIFQTTTNQKSLILLYGESDWCHWCNFMEKTTLKDPGVIKYINANFIPVKINLSKDATLFLTYQITKLPSIIVLNSKKDVVTSFSGFMNSQELIDNLHNSSVVEKKLVKQSATITITIVGNQAETKTHQLMQAANEFKKNAVIELLLPGEKSKQHPELKFPILNESAAYVCTDSQCSFPIFTATDLNKTINAMSDTSHKIATIKNRADYQDNFSVSLLIKKNLFIMLAGFWFLGFLLAFTPCVLPLLLLVAGFLGRSIDYDGRHKTIYLALAYIFTLSFTYAVVGLIAALTGVYIQAYFQNTLIIFLFSGLFALLALSLLGFYKIQLPAKLQHKLIRYNKYKKSYSYLEVIVMGVLITLIASPCAAAPLLGVLSYVGETGNLITGAMALFFLGLGVGTPLLLAAIFGDAIIPQARELQEGIKIFFGLFLLGISIWLINNIIRAELSMFLWSALIIYSTVVLSSLTNNKKGNFSKVWKTISYLILAYGLALFFGALLGNKDPLHPLSINQKITPSQLTFHSVKNLSELEQFRKFALVKHQAVLIDFYTEWCKACKKIEADFNTSTYQPILSKLMLLKVDLGESSTKEIATSFNIIAPPEFILIDKNGNASHPITSDDISPEKLENLQKE